MRQGIILKPGVEVCAAWDLSAAVSGREREKSCTIKRWVLRIQEGVIHSSWQSE